MRFISEHRKRNGRKEGIERGKSFEYLFVRKERNRGWKMSSASGFENEQARERRGFCRFMEKELGGGKRFSFPPCRTGV
jgi:hypothetical protein